VNPPAPRPGPRPRPPAPAPLRGRAARSYSPAEESGLITPGPTRGTINAVAIDVMLCMPDPDRLPSL